MRQTRPAAAYLDGEPAAVAFLANPVLYFRKGSFTVTIFAGGPATEAEARQKLLRLGPLAASRM